MFEFVLDLGPLHVSFTIGQAAEASAEVVEIGAYKCKWPPRVGAPEGLRLTEIGGGRHG